MGLKVSEDGLASKNRNLKEVRLLVEVMMCQKNCGTTVENALSSIKGSIKSYASFELSYASVTIDLNQFYKDNLSLISLDESTTTTTNHDDVDDEVIETIEN